MTDRLKTLLESGRRISALALMAACDDTDFRNSGRRPGTVIVASPLGDAHLSGRLMTESLVRKIGYETIGLGPVSPKQMAKAVESSQARYLILSWLLNPPAAEFNVIIRELNGLKQRPILILGGVAVNRAWLNSTIKDHYLGTLLVMPRIDVLGRVMLGLEAPDSYLWVREAPVRTEHVPSATGIPGLLSPPPPMTALSEEIRSGTWNFAEIRSWVSDRALFQLHLGIAGPIEKQLSANDQMAVLADRYVKQAYDLLAHHQGQYWYRWVAAKGHCDSITFSWDNQSDTRHFPRQTKAPYRNLADYVAFPDQKVGLCVVTAGNQETLIRNLMDSGQAGLALAVHAVMVQSAEAATEFIHAQLRAAASGKPLAPLTEDQMTHASYEGKRFSFGYSACPNLEDQDLFFNALPIQDSGLRLTDTFMIAPEATVTALVFTHPEAVYFSAT